MQFQRSITLWLILACVLVFVLQTAIPQFTDFFSFTPALALSEPWTFVTSIFLHSTTDITHILFNMIALFFFGIYLEQRISKTSYVLVFFLAGIIGNILFMITEPNSMVQGFGASGAIFGVMGALTVLEPRMTVFVSGIPMPMFVAAIVWFFLNFFQLLGPDIGYGAHIGGLLFGIAAGFYFRSQLSQRNAFVFKQTY